MQADKDSGAQPHSIKTFYVISSTEGCATNLLENSSYRKEYKENGYLAATAAAEADVILINTCAYSQQMETRATDLILEYKNKFPKAEIKIAGCLPKINPKKMRSDFPELSIQKLPENLAESHFDREDFEFLSEKHRLVLALRPLYFKMEIWLGFKFHPLHNIFKTVIVNEDFQLVTASTGCLGKCTFCAIKRAKGSLRSRPLEVITSEIKLGLNKNRKLFWLLGDDIGCWGLDTNKSIKDLLQEITSIPSQFGLVLNYFDPHYFKNNTEDLIKALTSPKFIGLNIPIQSGSQRILEKMQRSYHLPFVFHVLKRIKKKNPQIAIKTNIIVGFPGETWLDFFKSLRSIYYFDAILALKFTPRPNTPAASYENQVTEFNKNIRMLVMNIFIFLQHSQKALFSLFNRSRMT